MLAAVGDQHLDAGAVEAGVALGLGGDRLLQLGQAAGRRVAVVLAGRGRPRRPPRRCARGVGKSGSPAPKPMTSSPCAFRALALASTASVADSAMAARRRTVRFTIRRAWSDASPVTTGVSRNSGGRRCRALTCCHSDRRRPRPRSRIPADLLPADGRFGCGPSKVRPEQLDALSPRHGRSSARRTARRRCKHLVGAVRAGLRRPVRAARRLGDRARQRRHHRVLGRRHVRPRRAAQPAPRVRRVLVEVRRGLRGGAAPRRPAWSSPRRPGRPPRRRRRRRRRPLRPHPQRDLDRRGDGRCAARPAPPTAARRRRRHLRRRRAAVGPGRGRRLLLRPAEVLRLRRRAVGRRLLAGRRRAHRARSPRRDRWRPASLDLGDRPRQLPRSTRRTTRRRWPRWSCSTPSCEWMLGNRRPRLVRQAQRRRRPATSTAGPRRATGPRRSSPTRPSARAVVGTIDLDDALDADQGVARRCGPTASSTPTATASSAATSCASACSRRSTPPTSRPSPRASTTSSSTTLDGLA